MTDQAFGISVEPSKSKGGDLVYRGDDISLDVVVTNVSLVEIGFPLEYVQESGPVVKLVDDRAHDLGDVYLPRSLADHALRTQYVTMKPGESVSFPCMIMAAELEQFHGTDVDVRAEFMVRTEVLVGGKVYDQRARATIHIVGKGKTAP